MRRYLQGTLDYACGVYAVVNALSCVYSLNLAKARAIFEKTHMTLAARPALWQNYITNNTDHYWLVRHLLGLWCAKPAEAPYPLRIVCPLGAALPAAGDLCLGEPGEPGDPDLYLPEKEDPQGPQTLNRCREEALQVWQALHGWFTGKSKSRRAALLRFHRFLPNMPEPVVSHWTTVRLADAAALHLHDASSENNALHRLDKIALVTDFRPLLRIVPESVYLLEEK